jgi:hypothetical protein
MEKKQEPMSKDAFAKEREKSFRSHVLELQNREKRNKEVLYEMFRQSTNGQEVVIENKKK